MAQRGFGTQTLSGSPQPLIGTVLTAAVNPTPDSSRGAMAPGFADSVATLSVTAGTVPLFRYGDRVAVGASNSWNQGSTVAPDGGRVIGINSIANTIQVQGLLRAHASGEFVVLALPCAQINIDNGAALLYLGEDGTVGAASSTLITEISASTSYSLGFPAIGNVLETQKLWVLGTGADTYLPSILTI